MLHSISYTLTFHSLLLSIPLRELKFDYLETLSAYWTQTFITEFTTGSHQPLSWTRRIHSTLSHPISLLSILILSSHMLLGLFPSAYTTKLLEYFYLPHACYMPTKKLHYTTPYSIMKENNLVLRIVVSLVNNLTPDCAEAVTFKCRLVVFEFLVAPWR